LFKGKNHAVKRKVFVKIFYTIVSIIFTDFYFSADLNSDIQCVVFLALFWHSNLETIKQ